MSAAVKTRAAARRRAKNCWWVAGIWALAGVVGLVRNTDPVSWLLAFVASGVWCELANLWEREDDR